MKLGPVKGSQSSSSVASFCLKLAPRAINQLSKNPRSTNSQIIAEIALLSTDTLVSLQHLCSMPQEQLPKMFCLLTCGLLHSRNTRLLSDCVTKLVHLLESLRGQTGGAIFNASARDITSASFSASILGSDNSGVINAIVVTIKTWIDGSLPTMTETATMTSFELLLSEAILWASMDTSSKYVRFDLGIGNLTLNACLLTRADRNPLLHLDTNVTGLDCPVHRLCDTCGLGFGYSIEHQAHFPQGFAFI